MIVGMRRRRWLTIGWLIGGTFLPAVAMVAVFGCCELPLHGLVHRVLPLCQLATRALSLHHQGREPAAPAPARPEQKPVAERAWRPGQRPDVAPPLAVVSMLPAATAGQQTRRSLPAGAFRCDDDVGARLAFVDTLRL
jgi:hypothetical protein